MNYRMLAAAVAISASAFTGAACGDDDDPGGPTPLPTTFIYSSTLTPANEVPPVTNADATASGTLSLTMTITRDAGGGITGGSGVFSATLAGFPAGTNITAAHIHNNVAGQTAGIFVDTALGNGSVTITNGAGTFQRTANITAAQAEAIIANPAGFYFNVHTTLNPGGAIRGQLVFVSSAGQ